MATAEVDISWEQVRKAVNGLALERGEWAGYPLPVSCARLVLEPRYPIKALNNATLGDEPESAKNGDASCELVNSWHCWRRSQEVVIFRESGKTRHVTVPLTFHARYRMWMDTMIAANEAWSAEAERKAVDALAELVTEQQMRTYVLTGTFAERSVRSAIFYVFRKLRPTIASSLCGDMVSPLVAMCLHPIGYYEGTWAGAMVPTDDVIAHLLMMRGDERKFWSKANQIPLHKPNAGV